MKFILAILLLLTIVNVAMSAERRRRNKKARKLEGNWCCKLPDDGSFKGFVTSTLKSVQADSDDADCVALQPKNIGAWHSLKDGKCCGAIDDQKDCKSDYQVDYKKSRRSNRRKYRMRRA